LFPDVDRVFGSIGNFFETSFIGQQVAVGPPYTVELFKRIAQKVISECDRAKLLGKSVLFYITFSAWEDTEGYNMIKDSPYCTFAGILPAREHYYVNTNTPDEPPITATFNTVFFAMSYPMLTKHDYDYLFANMRTKNNMKLKIIKKINMGI